MNPFAPSTQYPPVTFDADPRSYHALGSEFKRGDKRFVMSRGNLRRFAANPWKWRQGGETEVTEAMAWGSLEDCLLLTPHLFSSNYEVCPETYPSVGMKCPTCKSITDSQKCAKCKTERERVTIQNPWNWNADYCCEWRERVTASGKEPVTRDALNEARIACARLLEDEHIAGVLNCSKRQVQIVVEYHDKDTGLVIPFKVMPDLLPEPGSAWDRFIPDLKTTKDASPDTWDRKVFAEGYHIQAATYLDATSAATGRNLDGFLHIIQESAPPYAVGRRMLSDEFVTIGRDFYKRALKEYCQCLATGKFGGYDDRNDNSANPILDGFRLTHPQAWMVAA